jgi:hypothetical protein
VVHVYNLREVAAPVTEEENIVHSHTSVKLFEVWYIKPKDARERY